MKFKHFISTSRSFFPDNGWFLKVGPRHPSGKQQHPPGNTSAAGFFQHVIMEEVEQCYQNHIVKKINGRFEHSSVQQPSSSYYMHSAGLVPWFRSVVLWSTWKTFSQGANQGTCFMVQHQEVSPQKARKRSRILCSHSGKNSWIFASSVKIFATRSSLRVCSYDAEQPTMCLTCFFPSLGIFSEASEPIEGLGREVGNRSCCKKGRDKPAGWRIKLSKGELHMMDSASHQKHFFVM